MIYLDANIFIYPISGTDAKSDACVTILKEIVLGEQEAGTSCLTWDEFQYALKKRIGKEKAIEQSATLLRLPNLTFFKVDAPVIMKAQKLTETYGVDPRDAIHAASAILNGCTEILSDDPDFDRITELKRKKI